MSRDITIVIGAGASVPFGMPTGQELRDKMLDRPNPSENLHKCIKSYLDSINIYSNSVDELFSSFFSRFERANTISIDSYIINQNETYSMIGKMLMAEVLSIEEKSAFANSKRSSCLVGKMIGNPNGGLYQKVCFQDNWIQLLLNHLNPKNGDYKDFLKRLSQINFISFNYDRIVEQNIYEHFFYNYFEEYNNSVMEDMRKQLYESLSFHYVYGKLGEIRLKEEDRRTHVLDLHDKNNYFECLNTAKKLRLIGSTVEDEDKFSFIKNSKQIFVLGFAYDEDNVKKIGLFNLNNNVNFYSTAIGMSEEIEGQLTSLLSEVNGSKLRLFKSNSPSSEAIKHLRLNK